VFFSRKYASICSISAPSLATSLPYRVTDKHHPLHPPPQWETSSFFRFPIRTNENKVFPFSTETDYEYVEEAPHPPTHRRCCIIPRSEPFLFDGCFSYMPQSFGAVPYPFSMFGSSEPLSLRVQIDLSSCPLFIHSYMFIALSFPLSF